jgi:hypothetical protein
VALADDLAQPDDARVRCCALTKLLEQLGPEDLEAVTKAVENPALTATFIHRKLKDNGFRVPAEAIQRHRRGACCQGTA